MSLIYIAGPYTAGTIEEVNANVKRAEEVGQQVLEIGLIPIIPHKISSHWDTWGRLTDWTHSEWLERFCKPLLARCDGIIFVDGWRDSVGAKIEHDFAMSARIPRFFSVRDLDEFKVLL